VAALDDNNVFVYRFDSRFPAKQARATALLRAGIAEDSVRVPHQALVEFVAATTKPLSRDGVSILPPEDARRDMEEMPAQFEVLYPDEEVVRVAICDAPPADSPGSTRISGRIPSDSAWTRSGRRTSKTAGSTDEYGLAIRSRRVQRDRCRPVIAESQSTRATSSVGSGMAAAAKRS